jgi:hypothetical protein
MLRKAMLAVVTVMLAASGVRIQMYCAILVMMAGLVLHVNARAFAIPILNHMEQASLVVSLLTMVGG